MKILATLAFLFLTAGAFGQTINSSITAQASSCSTSGPSGTATGCVILQLNSTSGSASITVSGTFSATLQFEVSGDGETNWAGINCYPPSSASGVSSTAAAGSWQCNVGGFTHLRVRASAYTSGTATVNLQANPVSARAVGSGGGTTGTGTTNTLTKWSGTTALGNSSATDDGTNPTRTPNGVNVASNALTYEIANDGTTGTTAQMAVCDNGSSQGIICPAASSTTNQPIGFAVSGTGTTGSAVVCIIGWCQVKMDATATARHYAIGSTTVNGELHDAGTSLTAGQPNFWVVTGCTGAGCVATVRLLTADDFTQTSTTGFVRGIGLGNTALGTSAIASGACATVITVTANGVATTDRIAANFNGDVSAVTGYAPVTTGALKVYVYPTANAVNFKVCNPTSSSITPGAATVNWEVVR